MLEVVSLILICTITYLLDCYIFSKFINEKFILNMKTILLSIGFAIIGYIVEEYDMLSKIIVVNLITYIILKIIYKKTFNKNLVGTIFIYLEYVISEVLFYIIFLKILGFDIKIFQDTLSGIFIVNFFDFLLCFMMSNIKIIVKYVSKIINWYDENKIINSIFSSMLIMIMCYVILYPIAFNKLFINYNLLILCIFLGIVVFVIGYFNQKSNNNKLTIEYGQLLEYVKDYEKEVVEKGKRQHEYKNQLIVINDMIPKTNKKLKKYVEDKLEVEKNIKDNVWLEKLTNLPSGGIKGLVYYKLKQMIEKNIEVYVEVDNELSDKKKWFNIEKYLEDYTRILGVYLDNAIEAAIESKDKQIIIEFKEKNDSIEFVLSNTYIGKINYDSIDKEKFSTKGKGRGYGLSLVKDIIDNNKLLSQSREINGKFYVQKLTIKK